MTGRRGGPVWLRVLGWGLRRLPQRWARRLGAGLGWVWHTLVPIRRAVARENVARALPALSPAARHRLVAAAFRHYGASVVETLRASAAPVVLAPMRGQAHLDAALGAGRGVIVLTAHLGHFERLVRAPQVAGARLWVVTRRFRSPRAQAAWAALRQGGAGLLAAGASGRAAVAALRRNEVVGYVLDQHDAGRRAAVVSFFGRPAATSVDVARLARITGAAVVPVFTWWDGAQHVLAAEPPVVWPRTGDPRADDVAGTAACVAVVEAAIRRHPSQWLWIHRRWKVPEAPAQGGGS